MARLRRLSKGSLSFACLFVLVAGCGIADQHAPTVRIALTPAYIPLGDAFHTEVLLDGSASRDQVGDPDGLLPLHYVWEVDDPDVQVVAGTLGTPRLKVRLTAASPTRVRLSVSTSDGATSTATTYIGVTAPR